MNCIQEEAVRLKGIAETKLQSRDFQLAHKMVVRAQRLDPNVDNISQLIIVRDVHCSAEKKFDGEPGWYGILQVQQAASDEATIKKQYRKFALLLQPDENKLPGAEAAFKLIGEAQRILLDLNSLAAHDRKRNGFCCGTAGEGRSILRIRRSELYRFSHRIPSFKLTGSEGENIPSGSFEVDPVSVPSNLDETTFAEEMKTELVF